MTLPLTLSDIQPFHQLEPGALPALPVLRERIDAILARRKPPAGSFLEHLIAVDFDEGSRSVRYQKQAWGAAGMVCALHSAFGDERYLRIARRYATLWMDANRALPAASDEPIHLEGESHFTWYDMAAGQRAARLAYVLDRLARSPDRDETLIARYTASLQSHLAYLADPANLARHSNHGLFQALCFLSVCRRFPATRWIAAHEPTAVAMFGEMLDRQFHGEAVHREHSPGYHSYILYVLRSALDAGVVHRSDFPDGFLVAAEEALAWMIAPDGRTVPIGDTDPMSAGKGYDSVSWERPNFVRSLRRGWRRKEDGLGGKLYDQAGLAFIRAEGRNGQRSYLAFTAQFHSRVHKQADDLSMVWYEGADAILADPGRFGYLGRTEPGSALFNEGFWYSDPRRIYVESTAAHNCVEIDGRSHPRRKVPFYGSAITRFEQAGAHWLIAAETRYRRFVRHRRTFVFRPGAWLVVLDWLDDHRGEPHDFAQCFKLGSRCAVHEGDFLPENGERMVFVEQFLDRGDPSLAKGQSSPALRGWVSERPYQLTAAPSLRFDYREVSSARIGTIVSVEEGARVIGSRLNATLSGGWIDVEARGSVERVEIAIGKHGEGRAPLRITPRRA